VTHVDASIHSQQVGEHYTQILFPSSKYALEKESKQVGSCILQSKRQETTPAVIILGKPTLHSMQSFSVIPVHVRHIKLQKVQYPSTSSMRPEGHDSIQVLVKSFSLK
jgi:hypothetical protein